MRSTPRCSKKCTRPLTMVPNKRLGLSQYISPHPCRSCPCPCSPWQGRGSIPLLRHPRSSWPGSIRTGSEDSYPITNIGYDGGIDARQHMLGVTPVRMEVPDSHRQACLRCGGEFLMIKVESTMRDTGFVLAFVRRGSNRRWHSYNHSFHIGQEIG